MAMSSSSARPRPVYLHTGSQWVGRGILREDVPARLSSRLFMSLRGIACHSLALQDDVTVGWRSIVSDLAIDVSATRPGPMSRAAEVEFMNLIEDRRPVPRHLAARIHQLALFLWELRPHLHRVFYSELT